MAPGIIALISSIFSGGVGIFNTIRNRQDMNDQQEYALEYMSEQQELARIKAENIQMLLYYGVIIIGIIGVIVIISKKNAKK